MASYTTPRTANVGDVWTAAWYNLELRDNIKWLHDLEISQGATFPASPLTGQRHLFVAGATRQMFTYDGAHWISDELCRLPLMTIRDYTGTPTDENEPAGYSPATATLFNIRDHMMWAPMVETVDTVKNNGMTLQGKLEGNAPRLSGAGTGGLAIGVATAGAAGTAFGADAAVAATESTMANGYHSGPWADIASGAVGAVEFSLWIRTISGGLGVSSWQLLSQTIRLRLKL